MEENAYESLKPLHRIFSKLLREKTPDTVGHLPPNDEQGSRKLCQLKVEARTFFNTKNTKKLSYIKQLKQWIKFL